MPRRPATILQSDIRRIIRAAKMEGAAVEVEIEGGKAVVRIVPSTDVRVSLAPEKEIVL